MAFCGKCGAQLQDDVQFCPACGAKVGAADSAGNAAPAVQPAAPAAPNAFQKFTDTADSTNTFDPNDIAQNKVVSALAYFGILFWLPLVACKDSKFGRFHANQGLLLLILSAVLGVAGGILNALIGLIFRSEITILGYGMGVYEMNPIGTVLIAIVSLVIGVFALALFLFGLIHTLSGKAKELPLIGKIKLIK